MATPSTPRNAPRTTPSRPMRALQTSGGTATVEGVSELRTDGGKVAYSGAEFENNVAPSALSLRTAPPALGARNQPWRRTAELTDALLDARKREEEESLMAGYAEVAKRANLPTELEHLVRPPKDGTKRATMLKEAMAVADAFGPRSELEVSVEATTAKTPVKTAFTKAAVAERREGMTEEEIKQVDSGENPNPPQPFVIAEMCRILANGLPDGPDGLQVPEGVKILTHCTSLVGADTANPSPQSLVATTGLWVGNLCNIPAKGKRFHNLFIFPHNGETMAALSALPQDRERLAELLKQRDTVAAYEVVEVLDASIGDRELCIRVPLGVYNSLKALCTDNRVAGPPPNEFKAKLKEKNLDMVPTRGNARKEWMDPNPANGRGVARWEVKDKDGNDRTFLISAASRRYVHPNAKKRKQSS